MSENIKRVKKKWGKIFEKSTITRNVVLTEELASEIEKDLDKVKVITPQELANKHKIRVSLAKRILNSYVEDDKLEIQHKRGRYTIYKK